jgi:uncharacterized cupin superfamily protein
VTSSAPHLYEASTRADLVDWGVQSDALEGVSRSTGLLVHKGPGNRPETGIWVCSEGRWRLSIPRDELCYFVAGRATYRSDTGETIEVREGTAVMFPAGWTGECTVHEAIRNTYILAADDSENSEPIVATPVMQSPLKLTELVDWGVIPTMIEGESRTSGKLLHKGPGGRSECGLWVCTPGKWNCHVTRDEYCHFLEGRSTYVHESGEVIEIVPDTLAFFPQDWKGVCTVHETIKKVYMIR